jgi:TolB-like protein
MPDPPLIQRLKERKLVQWAIAYLAGAFVVFQAVEVMAEPWGISPAFQRAVHIILVIGLFIALVLAWYHGEKGRQRVSGPELLMVAALLLVAGVALSTLSGSDGGTDRSVASQLVVADDDRPGIAVLLCDNFSPNPEDAFRAQGIHEEILLRLQGISSLRSIGRTSVLRFAEDPPEVSEIASALGVGFVGECSVLKDPDASQIRVTFQLLDASGAQVWADSYDRDLTVGNLFDIQSDIAQQVAGNIGAVLTPREQDRIEVRPTEDLEAYDLYLLGRTRWLTRSVPAMYEAIGFYEAAIELDSTYASAYAGLAETHLLLTFFDPNLTQTEVLDFTAQARGAAEHALTLDPALAVAHAALGFGMFWYDWDWDAAFEELRLATELDPGNSQARAWLTELLISLGRYEQAVVEGAIAARADPRSINENSAYGRALWAAGELEAAEDQLRYTVELENGAYFGFSLSVLLAQQGRFEEAEAAGLQFLRSWGAPADVVDSLHVVLRAAWEPGLRERGIAILSNLESTTRILDLAAHFYASLGAMDEAITAARNLVELHSYQVAILNWPEYRVLHSDPRFLAIVDGVGLPRPPWVD